MFVNIDCRQKIYAAKSKQTSTLLEIQNSNKSSFETSEWSFEYLCTLSAYLFNQWAPRNVALSPNFIFKEPERLPEIFLDSSLDTMITS